MCVLRRLNLSPTVLSAHLCTCVFEGDLAFLKRLLQANADANVADYDLRCVENRELGTFDSD
jgi:hypothetical protein